MLEKTVQGVGNRVSAKIFGALPITLQNGYLQSQFTDEEMKALSDRAMNMGSLCHLPPPTILSCDTMRELRFPFHCACCRKLIYATIVDFMMEFYCFLITNLRWEAALQ